MGRFDAQEGNRRGWRRRRFATALGQAGLAAAALALARAAWAQRPANPIARPPRPARPLLPGRFNRDDGVASGALPGIYTVADVDAKAETVTLRDETGRTAGVRVNENLVDLDSLKPGDQVEVDFLLPDPGSTVLEAAGIWKLQR